MGANSRFNPFARIIIRFLLMFIANYVVRALVIDNFGKVSILIVAGDTTWGWTK